MGRLLAVPLVCAASCDAGGLAVPVPNLVVADEVWLEAIFDTTTYVEVPITNTGSGEAVVSVTVEPPLILSVDELTIAPDDSSGVLVAWHPSAFRSISASVVLSSGADRYEAVVRASVLEDVDGDGYRDERAGGLDCDDSRPGVNPDADDDCGDGVDADCDGIDPAC